MSTTENTKAKKVPTRDQYGFTKQQRSKFRMIARGADLIDIIGSTDADPLTENKLLVAIKKRDDERALEALKQQFTASELETMQREQNESDLLEVRLGFLDLVIKQRDALRYLTELDEWPEILAAMGVTDGARVLDIVERLR